MKNVKDFSGLYQVQKTLRFALEPQGETLENIAKGKLVEEDEQLAKDYEKAKKIIDRYHKWFIEQALNKAPLCPNKLKEYAGLYYKASKSEKELQNLSNLQRCFRKQIKECFTKPEPKKYKNLFNKKLIREELSSWIEDDGEKEILGKFSQFTTYFTGFNKNRENIYTDKAITTAVGYRLIHENLPKFLDNGRIFNCVISKFSDLDFSNAKAEMADVLQKKQIEDLFNVEYFNETLTQNGIELYNTILGGKNDRKREKNKRDK